MTKYGPNGERASGRILAHNHIRRYERMPNGLNGFRIWYDFLDPEQQRLKGHFRNIHKVEPSLAGIEYVRCECGWRPDLGTHYRVKAANQDDYRCDSFEAVAENGGWKGLGLRVD